MNRLLAAAAVLALAMSSGADASTIVSAQPFAGRNIVTARDALLAGQATDWVCFADTDIQVQNTQPANYAPPAPTVVVQRSDADPAILANPAPALPNGSVLGALNASLTYREPGRAWWRVQYLTAGASALPVAVSMMGRGC